MNIPISDGAPVIRTDFSDDDAWNKLLATMQEPSDPFVFNLEVVDDPENDGATADQLMRTLPEDFPHSFILIADDIALSQQDQPVLVVDLFDEPGRQIRSAASQVAAIDNNLSIGNLSFADVAELVDETGVFRGFPEV